MSDQPSNGEWKEYRRLVLAELRRLDEALQSTESKLLEELKEMRNDQQQTNNSLSALQAKAGLLGFMAGLIVSVVSLLIKMD